MKARRVLVTIEMTTTYTTQELKSLYKGSNCYVGIDQVHQIQVNVIKKEKEVKR